MNLTYHSISFKDKKIYNAGTIELRTHQITLIIGESGVGKTTLLNHLFYLYQDKCIMVSQDNNLIVEHASVIDNICFFDSSKYEIAIEYMMKFNIEYLLMRKTKHLSGGEKRIVLLLRSFLNNKPILLIDEPTNNLDQEKVKELIDILTVMQSFKTLLIVTHDDRLFNIASTILEIQGNEVKVIDCMHNHITNDQNEIIVFDDQNRMTAHAFKPSIIKHIMIISLMILVIGIWISLYRTVDQSLDLIPTNQVDITNSIKTPPYKLIDSGFLPTKALVDYKTSENSKNIRKITELINDLNNENYGLNLYVEESDLYDKFEISILDMSNNKEYNIYQIYMETMKEVNGKYPNLQTYLYVDPQYLIDINIDKDNLESTNSNIDSAVYHYIEEQVHGVIDVEDGQTLLYSLILNDTKFEDLIHEDAFDIIMQGNYYIRSNETIELVNQIKIQTKIKDLISLTMISFITFLLMYVSVLIVEIKIDNKTIISARNLSINKNQVMKALYRKFIAYKLLIIKLVALTFLSLIITTRLKIDHQGLFIMAFLNVSLYLIDTVIVYLFVKWKVNNIYNFGGIYDDF